MSNCPPSLATIWCSSRSKRCPVWGTADPNEKVTVTLGSEKADTTADAGGHWMVKLAALPNGTPATTLTVAGKNTLTFNDVLVGDVWVCSGQSNMQFYASSAHNAATEIPKADDPQIRLFLVAQKSALEPQTDVQGAWMVCSPKTVPGFSAVGYFFGRELRQSLNRPIGLIGAYWGGMPAQAFTSSLRPAKRSALYKLHRRLSKTPGGLPESQGSLPGGAGGLSGPDETVEPNRRTGL